MSSSWLLSRVMIWVPLVLSLSVHEWAHAWSAYRLGDDTAERQGRLTMSPLAHIDPLGTFLLPLLGIPFGWAKPVPVNPLRFRRDVTMKTGMMITAAAGPISNVVLAVLSAVAFGLLLRFGYADGRGGIGQLLITAIQLNISLALFNLLPIPPLDGSRVVDGLLPYRLRPMWEQFQRYGQFALLGVMVFGGYLIAVPMSYATVLIYRLIATVAGVG
jgi:Zn-dependent protease